MIELGTSSIPNIAITNTVPEKSTARGRRAGGPDRGQLRPASAALLAVARDDEQQ